MRSSPPRRLRVLLAVLAVLVVIAVLLVPTLSRMLAEARRIEKETSAPEPPAQQPRPDTSGSPNADDVRAAEKTVISAPGDYEARLRYASLLGQERKYGAAIDQLKAATRILPQRAEPHIALGEIYEGTERFDLALDERREAVRLEADNPRAIAALGYTYVAFGWNLAARNLLEPGVSRHPNDPVLRNALALTLYQMMEYHGALDQILAAKRLDPQNHRLDGPLIDVYMRLNDPKSAAAAAERAMQSDETNAGFHIGRARALRASGELAGAEQEARWVLQREPANLEARYELALILKRKGDERAAQTELEAVVAANPLYESATALLAQIYHSQGRTADAALLQKSFEAQHAAADPSVQWSLKVGNEPNNAAAHRELGRIHLKRGKIARAVVELKEAVRLRPDDREAAALLVQAQHRP